MKIAGSKSQAILLKGKTYRGHPINVMIQGTRIHPSEMVTYLGIRLERGFKITSHLKYLRNIVVQSLNGLSRVGTLSWASDTSIWLIGINKTMTIYKGIVVGIHPLYGIGIFHALRRAGWRQFNVRLCCMSPKHIGVCLTRW